MRGCCPTLNEDSDGHEFLWDAKSDTDGRASCPKSMTTAATHHAVCILGQQTQ